MKLSTKTPSNTTLFAAILGAGVDVAQKARRRIIRYVVTDPPTLRRVREQRKAKRQLRAIVRNIQRQHAAANQSRPGHDRLPVNAKKCRRFYRAHLRQEAGAES